MDNNKTKFIKKYALKNAENDKDEIMKEKEKKIKELENDIIEKEKKIKELENDIIEKDEMIEYLKKLLTNATDMACKAVGALSYIAMNNKSNREIMYSDTDDDII